VKQLRSNRNPKIGFWLDNDPVRLYIGAQLEDLHDISNDGVRLPNHRWVTTYLEPNSVVLDIPMKWLFPNMDQRFTGNRESDKNKLLQKPLYYQWKRFDYEYYCGLKVKIMSVIPPRFVAGYMKGA